MSYDTGPALSKEQEDFSSLFDLSPNIAILNLNNGFDNITAALKNFGCTFDANITTVNSLILNELRVKIKKSNYEYGVICNLISNHDDKKNLMKIIASAIRDSGHIIVLEEKDKSLDDIYSLLEEFDFGAINSIDIFEKYNLIMGKKLHMWGMS